MRHRLARMLAAAATATIVSTPFAVAPAGAVHLFPLTPTSDPLGHDCAKALTRAAPGAAAAVGVAGFSFLDTRTNSSTTNITAGQSVTWTWALDHCHSVTLANGSGTRGSPGFMPANQEQLVRQNGAGNDSFNLSFATPGTYAYSCVHHASVGMTGTVVVAAARAAPAPPPPPSGGSPDPTAGAPNRSVLPVTGPSADGGIAAVGVALVVVAMVARWATWAVIGASPQTMPARRRHRRQRRRH